LKKDTLKYVWKVLKVIKVVVENEIKRKKKKFK
jgi:hypothetical protein